MFKKVVFIIVPLAILGGLIGWRIKSKVGVDQQLKTGMSAKRATSVQVGVAAPAIISGNIDAAGTLDSPFKVQLTSRVSGKITSLTVREGDSVTAGQTLVKIDPSTAQASLSQAEANLAQARARLAQAKIEASPNRASVKGQIDQQTAALNNLNAELTQTKRTVDSTLGTLAGAVSDAQSRVFATQSTITTSAATLEKERATRKNLQTKVDRNKELLDKGFIAERDYDDSVTALDLQDKQVQIAIATLGSANQANLNAKTQLAQAKSQLEIAKAKGKADIAASQAKVNQGQSTVRVAQANQAMNPAYLENIKALAASVSVAEAQVSQARTILSETDLKSSINGVITARNADEGALSSPGQAVLVIQSLDWLFFVTSIPVELGDKVRVGQVAKIAIEGNDGRDIQGAITNINPSADPQSRQISLKIRIENIDHALRPGLFGKINFSTDAKKVDVSVPKEAVLYTGKIPSIAVVNKDNKIEMRLVKLGVSDEKVIEVTEGVAAGERVVTLSYDPLKDGKEVKVADPKEGGKSRGEGKGSRKP
ncbi:MAG: efflux RND transporter periplasmic adaptor subunit [Armatimonadota bacterium]